MEGKAGELVLSVGVIALKGVPEKLDVFFLAFGLE